MITPSFTEHEVSGEAWAAESHLLVLRFFKPAHLHENETFELRSGFLNSPHSQLGAAIPFGEAALGVQIPFLRLAQLPGASALSMAEMAEAKACVVEAVQKLHALSARLQADFFRSSRSVEPTVQVYWKEYDQGQPSQVERAELLLVGPPNHHPYWTI